MSLIGDILDRVLFPNREIHVIPVLDGAFSPNRRLDRARQLGDDIKQPDDIALGPDGALYVSSGQSILRCTGNDFENRTEFATLGGVVGGLAATSDGRLLACVSGRGLVALSIDGKIAGSLESAAGERITCPLSVTVTRDGMICLTDGSRHNTPEHWLTDLMENRAPSGRLILCDASLVQAKVRADGLAWPYGVAAPGDGREVWVAESWAHRLSAFSIAGNERRALIKNFTGYPARLSEGASGDAWMAFLALRTQLTEFVLRERDFCNEMIRTVPSDLWIGPSLDSRINPREPIQIGRIKKLGIQKPWAPPRSYGLVARLDGSGVATETWHSRVDGRVHGVTSVRRIGARVIAVSKGCDCLVELPLQRGEQER